MREDTLAATVAGADGGLKRRMARKHRQGRRRVRGRPNQPLEPVRGAPGDLDGHAHTGQGRKHLHPADVVDPAKVNAGDLPGRDRAHRRRHVQRHLKRAGEVVHRPQRDLPPKRCPGGPVAQPRSPSCRTRRRPPADPAPTTGPSSKSRRDHRSRPPAPTPAKRSTKRKAAVTSVSLTEFELMFELLIARVGLTACTKPRAGAWVGTATV